MNRITTEIEDAMHTVYATSDELKGDIDRLVVQVEKLVRERAHIIKVLSTFYRSEVTTSSALNPLLDLARDLDPTLDDRPVR